MEVVKIKATDGISNSRVHGQPDPEMSPEVQPLSPMSPRLWIARQTKQKSKLLLLTSLGLVLDSNVAIAADLREQEQAEANADFAQRLQDTRDLNSGCM